MMMLPIYRVMLTGIAVTFLWSCTTTNYGDNELRLTMASHGKDVMWVPTQVAMAHHMLSMANVRNGDLVYDLGSGDGVIPIEAAKKYQVRAVGIEYNADLVKLSQRNALRAQVQDLVTFRQGDIFKEDFSAASVLTLYLGDDLNAKLIPTILKMKPGTRVVSNTFQMVSWIPDQTLPISNGETAYLWIVPVFLDGHWTIKGIPGQTEVRLSLRQKKQFFDGSLYANNQRIAHFDEGSIRGSNLEFSFEYQQKIYIFTGQIKNSEIVGMLNNDPSLSISGKPSLQ